MEAKVTVIIPFYNRRNVITRAIDSVLLQTFENWRLLLIDDNSTDDPSVVLERYLNDRRIECLRLERNSGAAAACNVGIKNSKTPYIALLDSDDAYHADFLMQCIQAIERTDAGIGFSYTGVGVIGNEQEVVQRDRRIWTIPEAYAAKKKPYLYQLQLGTAAGILIKKEVFDKVGYFDESFRASEDTDWFIRVSEYYKGLPIHKNLIFKDNSTPDRLTTSYKKNADAYRILIAKNKDDINASPFLVKRWYYKSMWLNFYNNDRKAAASDYEELAKHALLNAKIRVTYLAGRVLPTGLFIRLHKQMANLK